MAEYEPCNNIINKLTTRGPQCYQQMPKYHPSVHPLMCQKIIHTPLKFFDTHPASAFHSYNNSLLQGGYLYISHCQMTLQLADSVCGRNYVAKSYSHPQHQLACNQQSNWEHSVHWVHRITAVGTHSIDTPSGWVGSMFLFWGSFMNFGTRAKHYHSISHQCRRLSPWLEMDICHSQDGSCSHHS